MQPWRCEKAVEQVVVNIREAENKVARSNTMAGMAVFGDLGWRKLKERKEEKKLLYGR